MPVRALLGLTGAGVLGRGPDSTSDCQALPDRPWGPPQTQLPRTLAFSARASRSGSSSGRKRSFGPPRPFPTWCPLWEHPLLSA